MALGANSHSTTPTARSGSTTVQRPSPQMTQFLVQSAARDGSMYGRLAGQPLAGDPAGRAAHHTARVKHEIERFDTHFRSTQH
ncbi:hypothetical protein VTH82DRAFT_8361 [Thermothelomyces myriococcoides]